MILSVRHLSKSYRLGRIGATRLRDDLERAWRRLRGHPSAAPSTPAPAHDPSRLGPDGLFWALRDVSFDVSPGEVVGIIGRNGAGKSTLLKILSRITEPTAGEAVLRGRVASLLEVGTGFHPDLTGRDNIFLNGAILGMRRAEVAAKLEAIVDFAGIGDFLDTPVKRYSSGMYVRLAFAVAAHLEPEILIVDEVLAVGDAEFQRRCLGKMEEVSRTQGRTILFVSHNLRAICELCQRVVLIEGGQVKRIGPATPVVTEYLSEVRQGVPQEADLRNRPRHEGLALEFKLERILWEQPPPLRHGEAGCLIVHFRILRSCRDLSIGFAFTTVDGTTTLTYESDFQSANRLPGLEPGLYSASLRFEALPLVPGPYFLGIGARTGEHRILDFIHAAMPIEVRPGSNTPSFLMDTHSGVRLPLQIQWSL